MRKRKLWEGTYRLAAHFSTLSECTMLVETKVGELTTLLGQLPHAVKQGHWQEVVAEASRGKLNYNPEGGINNMDKKQIYTGEADNVMQICKLIYAIADLTGTYGIPCNEQLEEAAKRLEEASARLRAMKSAPEAPPVPAKSLDIKKLKTQQQE